MTRVFATPANGVPLKGHNVTSLKHLFCGDVHRLDRDFVDKLQSGDVAVVVGAYVDNVSNVIYFVESEVGWDIVKSPKKLTRHARELNILEGDRQFEFRRWVCIEIAESSIEGAE